MKAKVILIASFILSTFMSVAQPGGGMGGPGGGMGGGPEGGMGPGGMASVSPLAAAGYFEIDSKEALKKMKIKDKDRSKAAAALFNTYQQNYDELTATFGAEIEAVSNSQKEMSEARESISSQEEMRAMMSKIREKITATTETIKPEMVKYHEALNSGLKATLTEDELKKWSSYYTTICRNNRFQTGERRGGQRGGEGRGRGGEAPAE